MWQRRKCISAYRCCIRVSLCSWFAVIHWSLLSWHHTMHNVKAIEQHVRTVATRNGLSVEKTGKRYTVSEEGRVIFTATSVTSIIF